MRRQETHLQDELTQAAHDSAMRTGVCAGVGMVLVFIAWLFVANRVPASEKFALERNVIAASVLAILFMVPVVRFMWQAGRLLAASLAAWWIFSLAYRLLCIGFYTPMRVFILGSVVCMILATLSWIATLIWRTRASHMASHHHVSHSNHHV
jgi:hypothetical protein